MTCEVIVMNRHAVALAADSAVTVTQWVDGKEERRYFKSVNKVFQLSRVHPVGMMVYGSGDLQQAPWELLAKEYRKHLGDKSFDTLDQYGDDLFSFIKNASDIFPKNYQEDVFKTDCEKAALLFFFQNVSENSAYKAATTDADKISISTTYLDSVISNLDKEPFIGEFIQTDLDNALSAFLVSLAASISASGLVVVPEKLAEFAIKAIFKKQSYMGETGVVIAGFGDKDFFPGYREYKCFGNILGKVAYKCENQRQIDYHNHSSITGFATTNMVDTFQFGIGLQSYINAGQCCTEALKKLVTRLGVTPPANFEDLVGQEEKNFRNALMQKSREQNYEPLTRVVSALPVDEMAGLAETLVSLESLKEKVTAPTESVGGPVDVAVITRGDGLVWIKRKHYFQPDLNPRYFQRNEK